MSNIVSWLKDLSGEYIYCRVTWMRKLEKVRREASEKLIILPLGFKILPIESVVVMNTII